MNSLAPLSSCPLWHPTQPSQIRVTHHTGPRGKSFSRRHCALCRTLMAKARHQRDRRPLAWVPYGVHRLIWTAPETLLNEVAYGS